jgi:hypothetical protein
MWCVHDGLLETEGPADEGKPFLSSVV